MPSTLDCGEITMAAKPNKKAPVPKAKAKKVMSNPAPKAAPKKGFLEEAGDAIKGEYDKLQKSRTGFWNDYSKGMKKSGRS